MYKALHNQNKRKVKFVIQKLHGIELPSFITIDCLDKLNSLYICLIEQMWKFCKSYVVLVHQCSNNITYKLEVLLAQLIMTFESPYIQREWTFFIITNFSYLHSASKSTQVFVPKLQRNFNNFFLSFVNFSTMNNTHS